MSDGLRNLRRRSLIAGLLLLMVGAFHWRLFAIGTRHQAYLAGDFVTMCYPIRQILNLAVQEGSLPLWSPYVWSGYPLVACATPLTFYPPKAITFWLEGKQLYVALEAIAILHILLAGVLMCWFVRGLGVGRTGAVAAAVVFMFNGYFEAHLNHSNLVESAVWLPAILMSLGLGLRERRLRHVAAAGVFLGMSLLASFVEIVAYMLAAVLVYVAYWTFVRIREASGGARAWIGRSVAVTGAAVCVGLGIGAIQLLPLYELSRLSVHTGLTFEQATQLSLPPGGLLAVVIPRVLESRNMVYCGSFAFVMAVLGACAGGRRRAGVFVVLALASLAVALGRYSLVYRALYVSVPGIDNFRTPERWLLVYVFAISVLVGVGVDVLGSREKCAMDRPVRYMRNAIPAIAFLGVVVAVALRPESLPEADLHRQLAMFGLVMVVGMGLMSARVAFPARANVIAVLAVALLFSDAFITVRGHNLDRQDPFLLYARAGRVLSGLADDAGQYRITIQGRAPVKNWPGMLGVEHTLANTPLPLRRYRQYLKWAGTNPQLEDALNVKYLFRELKLARVNGSCFPRAFLVNRYLVETDPKMIGSQFARPGRVDLRTCVVLEEEPERSGSATRIGWAEAGAIASASTGSARVTAHGPNSLEVRVRADRDSFLVLSEIFYPGWEAKLDGRAARVLRANYVFRAVFVPEGEHVVSLRYRPRSLMLGAALTALFVVLAAGGLVVGRGKGGR